MYCKYILHFESYVYLNDLQLFMQGEEEIFLNLKTLKKFIYYKNCKALIEIKESCVVGDFQALLNEDLPNIERGINIFFQNYDFGVIEANKRYFAIWKFEEELQDKCKEVSYYLFNDKPNEDFVRKTQPDKLDKFDKADLSACLLRFLDPSEIGIILSEQLQVKDEDDKTDFFIHEIRILTISEPMTDEEILRDKATPIKPELRAYTAVGENGACLLGSFNQANELLFKMDTRDKQQAANALVTLAMTKLFDPYLWYCEVLDDILKIGDKLCDENAKNIPEVDEEDPENLRDYLLPSEIGRDFFIGVNEIGIDVEEDATVGKLDELGKGLEDFFANNKMGILRQDQVLNIYHYKCD